MVTPCSRDYNICRVDWMRSWSIDLLFRNIPKLKLFACSDLSNFTNNKSGRVDWKHSWSIDLPFCDIPEIETFCMFVTSQIWKIENQQSYQKSTIPFPRIIPTILMRSLSILSWFGAFLRIINTLRDSSKTKKYCRAGPVKSDEKMEKWKNNKPFGIRRYSFWE